MCLRLLLSILIIAFPVNGNIRHLAAHGVSVLNGAEYGNAIESRDG